MAARRCWSRSWRSGSFRASMSRRSSGPATARRQPHCCAEPTRNHRTHTDAIRPRRQPVVASTCGLARAERNTMKKEILVSVDSGETRVAVLEAKGATGRGKDGGGRSKKKKATPGDEWKVAELYVERRGRRSIVGNIYKGKVDNVLPGMEAAFVDIGLERNGFLHVDEIVTPDGKAAPKRGRGRGRSIAELIKPGQE